MTLSLGERQKVKQKLQGLLQSGLMLHVVSEKPSV